MVLLAPEAIMTAIEFTTPLDLNEASFYEALRLPGGASCDCILICGERNEAVAQRIDRSIKLSSVIIVSDKMLKTPYSWAIVTAGKSAYSTPSD